MGAREQEAVTTENAEKKTKSASGENRNGCIVTDWFHAEMRWGKRVRERKRNHHHH
jgi:hypothetical protein